MPLDEHPRACTGTFPCVRLVHVCVCLWTCMHVPVLALFGVYTRCTRLSAFERASTCLYRPLSVCTPCLCECTPLDVHPRAGASPFRCVLPVYVCTPLDVHPRAGNGPFPCEHPMNVGGRASTCLHWPFSVCTPCARVCTPLEVHPRTCTGPFRCVPPCARVCMPLDVHPRVRTGPFRCVRPVHVCVRLCTFINVPVPALIGVYALFM